MEIQMLIESVQLGNYVFESFIVYLCLIEEV